MKGSDSAFPCLENTFEYGLTKREWLAGMAMKGLLANQGQGLYDRYTGLEQSVSDVSKVSVAFADGLIAALKETK